jgi:hypothetical protein
MFVMQCHNLDQLINPLSIICQWGAPAFVHVSFAAVAVSASAGSLRRLWPLNAFISQVGLLCHTSLVIGYV